ncbi:zinc ribbon domain-containing protein [Streptomyces coryli]|uniref:zinc ribbon domain-containing protein n=1 Tax=Streptomyces coryli TaxID=1128680 RepID=UPI003B83A268
MWKADRWFASSKTCAGCGHINRALALADRTWECPVCGAVHDRDHNAAGNLLAAMLADSGAPRQTLAGKFPGEAKRLVETT